MGETQQALIAQLVAALGTQRLWFLEVPADKEPCEALCLPEGTLRARPLDGQPVSCTDLRARGKEARELGVPLVVDAGVCGAWGCPAVRLGAHVELVELGRAGYLVALARDAERLLPGACSRLDTLPALGGEALASVLGELTCERLGWRQTSDTAQVVAAYLRCHPQVEELRYPGLKGDPSFEVAARTLQQGFGPVIDYRRSGSRGWTRLICADEGPKPLIAKLEGILA